MIKSIKSLFNISEFVEKASKTIETVEAYNATGYVLNFEYFLTVALVSNMAKISGSHTPQVFSLCQAIKMASTIKNGKGEHPDVIEVSEWKRLFIEDTKMLIDMYL